MLTTYTILLFYLYSTYPFLFQLYSSITTLYSGLLFSGSPFRVLVKDVVDVSKVKCSGPGLANRVTAHAPQTFTVDSSKAGLAPLEVQLYGPKGT